MAYDFDNDPRIDPRLVALLKAMPASPARDFASREELIAISNSPKALAYNAKMRAYDERNITPTMIPLDSMRTWREDVISQPDGNTIHLQIIRPDTDEKVATIYYIHGGGMATLSCFDPSYQAFSRLLVTHGVAVVLVDFRNSVVPSSVPELAPFPGGLHDCLSGLRWTLDHADEWGLDTSRVVVAGESGGGNLTLATGLWLTRHNETNLVKGLYALCPYLAGEWPAAEGSSARRNNDVMLNLGGNWGRIGYGIEAFEARDPLAWPGFATVDDVTGFPTTVISVNECDPLCDDGIAFYRLLMKASVNARCRQVMGTIHASEMFPYLVPEIGRDTARDLAAFARD